MTALHLITNGRVDVSYPGGSYPLGKGDVIGICELNSEIHFLGYQAAEETTILTYPADNLDALAEVHRRSPVPIAGGERVYSLNQFREFLEKGKTMEEALRTRKFEHDGPNWTPRISGLLSPDGSYKMSILKASDLEGRGCNRYTYDYDPIPGLGHFLHTYVCDGNPVIPTFQGEPERVAIPQDMEAFVDTLWKTLNEDNKISLFVRYTDLATGEYRQRIINRYE